MSEKTLNDRQVRFSKLSEQDDNLQQQEPPPVPENLQHQADNPYADRARRARRLRHRAHRRRNKLKNANKRESDDDDEDSGSPQEEINEDTSMAALANSMSSQQPLSTAARRSTNMAAEDTHLQQNEDAMKEWIPRFAKSYSYFSLFRFASASDYTLMAIGTIAAMGAGCCIPAIIYLLGNLIRTKALVDKMNCSNVGGSSSTCEKFLEMCDKNDHSLFSDRRFLDRPSLLNNSMISTDHMESFVTQELNILFVYTLLSSIYFFCWNYASQNQGGILRRAYFESLVHKDMSWFDTQDAPDSFNRLMENTRTIIDGIGESIPAAISLIVMCVLCVPLAVYHGWQLSVTCLATFPFSLGTCELVNRCTAMSILRERRAYRVAHDLVKEVISNIRTVIGYNLQATESSLYQREISRGDSYVLKRIFLQSVAVGLMYVVNFGLWSLVFWYGMRLVLNNALETCTDKTVVIPDVLDGIYDAGDMFIVIMSMLFGFSNVYNVVVVVNAMKVAKLCGRDVLKVIDTPNGVDSLSSDGICLDEEVVGKVEFIDVRFTYPGNNRGLALNQLSFVVEPNTMVAIVGLADSGKSTTLKLICKEYLADSGFVQIDGHDIRSLNTKWLRSQIGYIPQEVHLLDMSIEDNVRMGKWDANFLQIQEACIKAGAHDFIINFKEGYKTKLGHKGSKLTPGQKQLLAIARALIREPKILLFDEPTNALDSESVMEFMYSLQTISKDRTVILVAHQLATVVHADMIYVLKNGKVVEQGNHNTLVKNKGPYNQLCIMNRPSNSYHPGRSKIEGFDTSEMTIISCVKTFSQKPILPNLYNNMLSVDPVVSKVTDAILNSDTDTERGFHVKLEWALTYKEKLKITTIEQDNTFGKELQWVPDLYNLNTIDPIRFPTNQIGKDRNTDEEYHSISVLNADTRIWLGVMRISSASYWLIIFGAVSTILFSAGIPCFGYILALIIDVLSDIQGYPQNWKWASVFENNSFGSFPVMISFAILIIGAYSGVFAFFQDFFLNLAAYKSVQKIRRLLYHCILNQDISFFEDPKYSPMTLASILFQDADSIRHLTLSVYGSLLQCICMFIVPVTLCVVHSLKLTGYIILTVLLVVGINLTDGWLAKKQHGRTIHALQYMSDLILQVFQSKHVITACQIEPYYLNEFTTIQRKSLGAIKFLSYVRVLTYGISQGAVFWGFGIVLYLGADRISAGADSFLDVMINGFLIMFGLFNLGTNLSVIMGFKHINKGGKRILDIINRKPLMYYDVGLDITEEDCSKDIEFINTHFWRHQCPDSALLKGVNLAIPPMQVTSIVGYPGNSESGKTAYLELLGKYYDATGGLVTIAGKDIRYYSAVSLREHLSIVCKNPELFSRTVAENIALGATSRKPSMEEIIQAAQDANAHNMIVSLPEGYETRIGGEHDYLSSAQKQKINIARALLKNPKILIFDNVTSQLDKEGEKAILETITMIKPNRTIIMISHRIQPVQDTDWIVVMEQGYLEEQGTHDMLLRQRSAGTYTFMWKSQNPLDDESFLNGTTFTGRNPYEKTGKSYNRIKLPSPKQPSSTSGMPQSQLQRRGKEDDEKEQLPIFFSFLGLGIVEPVDEIVYGDNRKGGDIHRN